MAQPPKDLDGQPGRALAQAAVAMVAVALLVGVAVGFALLTAARIGGLSDAEESAAEPQDDSPASLYMPAYEPTEEAGDGVNLPGPQATPEALPSSEGSEKAKPKAKGITLFVAPQQVGAGQRINFNGVYPGQEGATLQVQRKEGGWTDFPVTATVRGGSFETWIQTSRTGRAQFRVYDAAEDKASNVVTVQIG